MNSRASTKTAMYTNLPTALCMLYSIFGVKFKVCFPSFAKSFSWLLPSTIVFYHHAVLLFSIRWPSCANFIRGCHPFWTKSCRHPHYIRYTMGRSLKFTLIPRRSTPKGHLSTLLFGSGMLGGLAYCRLHSHQALCEARSPRTRLVGTEPIIEQKAAPHKFPWSEFFKLLWPDIWYLLAAVAVSKHHYIVSGFFEKIHQWS